jgi:hypothetical protein
MYEFDHKEFDKILLLIHVDLFLDFLSPELLQNIKNISYEKYHYKPDYYYERPDVLCQVLRELCGISYVTLIESMCVPKL